MRAPKNSSLWALLVIAATARLLMQMAAMPPYAGLDELFHVARLSFVRAEGRNPTMSEPSVPHYLQRSVNNDPAVAAAACIVGFDWWKVVRQRRVLIDQNADTRPYFSTNYEAQQPSLYYSIAALAVPPRSAMFELRAWRMLSVFFALVIVIATAMITVRFWGPVGILAAAIVVALPTWETLVVRASNDAFACALVAIATVATVYEKPLLEIVAWPLAIASKLYTWPLLIVLPIFWREQRASRRRVIPVLISCALGFALTILDLVHRTRNPLGLFAFDPAGAPVASIHVIDAMKIWFLTLVWTSGPHWDALRPLALVLYAVPIGIAVVMSRARAAAWCAVAAFACAQIINVLAYARSAQNGMPAGGKEGWYWYALVPVAVPFLLAPAMRFRLFGWWLVIWDLLMTEVANFHDFAGDSSPLQPTTFFRWGPWHWPFTAHLDGIAVGPLVGALVVLRLIHLGAFGVLSWRAR